MRIAIDIRRMYEFGLATYIRNVVRTLGQVDPVNEYFLVGAAARFEQLGPLQANFQLVPMQNPETTFANYLEMNRVIRGLQVDLVHYPHTFWRPPLMKAPYVITVHDLLDYMYRARTSNGMRRTIHSYMTRQVMHHAARIFAVSNFTKRDVSRYFNIKSEKIEVVYNALDETFMRGHSTAAEQALVRGRYQVDSPFLLYAGRISPHKNVARIIEAFSALKAELAKDGAYPDLKLIIIGDEVSKNPDIRRAVIRSGMQHEVRFLGFVSIDVLRVFFDMAKVFVFPSLYEGFGLPPLEAMAHGTPVVSLKHFGAARGGRQCGVAGESGKRLRDQPRPAPRSHRPGPARTHEGSRSRAIATFFLGSFGTENGRGICGGRGRVPETLILISFSEQPNEVQILKMLYSPRIRVRCALVHRLATDIYPPFQFSLDSLLDHKHTFFASPLFLSAKSSVSLHG